MRSFKTPIEILFEDDHVLLVNKPAGLPCHATPDPQRPHLLSQLDDLQKKLILLHRLDVETSGVLILSKTPEANLNLQNQLKNRDIEKYYWAVGENKSGNKLPLSLKKLHQILQETSKPIEFKNHLALTRKNKYELNLPVHSGGDLAWSRVKKLKKTSEWISFEVQILTGRKHQIRSHLQSLGFPLIGDKLYNEKPTLSSPRLTLHSWRVKFTHPVHRQPIEIEAPRPMDLKKYFEEI